MADCDITASIVTVCLNNGQTLEETITSVLRQDYQDIQYMIVDGGSTDGTHEILRKHRDRISKIVSEPDNGTYDAMNKGIKMATGEVVGFLNAGDFYANSNVIRTVVEALKASEADCCYGDIEYVAKNSPDRVVRNWKSCPFQNGLFEKGWHPPHPTFFAKKQTYEKYGYFNLKFQISADYELMLRFLRKHRIKSCYVPRILVRMRTGGKSNKNPWQIIKANIECYQAWKINNLNMSPFIMIRKPVSKLTQYLQKG